VLTWRYVAEMGMGTVNSLYTLRRKKKTKEKEYNTVLNVDNYPVSMSLSC